MISVELAAAIDSSGTALISVVSTFLFKRQMVREQQAVTERDKIGPIPTSSSTGCRSIVLEII